MASTSLNFWFVFIVALAALNFASAQYLDANPVNATKRICKATIASYTIARLNALRGCVVVLGDLKIYLMEGKQNFTGVSFPELREVTGYLLFYRVKHLQSLGQLFPGLTRIRGSELFMNYALIVHDMEHLEEIGLYSLAKIDRGSVIIYAQPTTCFLHSINWNAISPNVRHVISRDPVDSGRPEGVQCTTNCMCTTNYTTNYCWNNRKCQRFLEGPDEEMCHEQCLGCRMTRPDACTTCRHYTHDWRCVSACPNNTYVVKVNKYCLTLEQCHKLDGWIFNNTCVFECPLDYKAQNKSGVITCEPCPHCSETCNSLYISSLDAMQDAQRCVYVNGSLTIHVRAVVEAMEELRIYLTRIKEVRDYIYIYGSFIITSLDFLPSLRLIRGKKLLQDTYSLVVHDMLSLQTLFTPNVTGNLTIEAGTLKIFNNSVLCKKEIDKITPLFPKAPEEIHVPEGKNGYSGICTPIHLGLKVDSVDTTTALVTFSQEDKPNVTYSVLYKPLTPGEPSDIAPESCSETKWYAITIKSLVQKIVAVPLTNLKPASNYALCIETYIEYGKHPTRSPIINFSTKVGRPVPPFLTEVVSPSANSIVIHWVNHLDYTMHISHYELDVMLVDTFDDDVNARNQCEDIVSEEIIEQNYDYSPHAVVMRPPDEYEEACETMCGILSRGISGAMVQDDFDPCRLGLDCDDAQEPGMPENKTFSEFNYYSSVSVEVNGSKKEYQIGNLAPYRDYRIRLRACAKLECSRSTRRVVRTKALRNADLAKLLSANATDGKIIVAWEGPSVPNGPVLSYIIQVKPTRKYPEKGAQIPQETCILNNKRNATVTSIIEDSYSVRVCTKTLSPEHTCTEWLYVKAENTWYFLWTFLYSFLSACVTVILLWLISLNSPKYCGCVPEIRDDVSMADRRRSDELLINPSADIFSPIRSKDSRADKSKPPVDPYLDPVPGTSGTNVIEMCTFSAKESEMSTSSGSLSSTPDTSESVLHTRTTAFMVKAEETDSTSLTSTPSESLVPLTFANDGDDEESPTGSSDLLLTDRFTTNVDEEQMTTIDLPPAPEIEETKL